MKQEKDGLRGLGKICGRLLQMMLMNIVHCAIPSVMLAVALFAVGLPHGIAVGLLLAVAYGLSSAIVPLLFSPSLARWIIEGNAPPWNNADIYFPRGDIIVLVSLSKGYTFGVWREKDQKWLLDDTREIPKAWMFIPPNV